MRYEIDVFGSGMEGAALPMSSEQWIIWQGIDLNLQYESLCTRLFLSTSDCDRDYFQLFDQYANLWNQSLETRDQQLLLLKHCNSMDSKRKAELAKFLYDFLSFESAKPLELQTSIFCSMHRLELDECDDVYSIVFPQENIPKTLHLSCGDDQVHSRKKQSSEMLLPGGREDSIGILMWTFWDTGELNMPSFLQFIFQQNKKQALKCGYTFQLVSLATINNYLGHISIPSVFYKMSPNHQSDYIRAHLLHIYGGLWVDTDYLLIQCELEMWWKQIPPRGSLFFEEYLGKIGYSIIMSKPQSSVFVFLIDFICQQLSFYSQRLELGLSYVNRDFIGPEAIKNTWDFFSTNSFTYPLESICKKAANILLVCGNSISSTINIVRWDKRPCYEHSTWFFDTADEARVVAMSIKASGVPVVATWTLSALRLLEPVIFYDERSVFYQLLQL